MTRDLIPVKEAAIMLMTTSGNLNVTAFHYKKKHGRYPDWYKSKGVQNVSAYVDVNMIMKQREYEANIRVESWDMYYQLRDKGYSDRQIALIMVREANIGHTVASWCTFLYRDLFKTPNRKFNDRALKLREFHRIAKGLL